MHGTMTLQTAPEVEPVTLAEAKAHCRVDYSDDDTLLTTLITAVRKHLDGPSGILGKALVSQTWDYTIDEFPEGEKGILLPLSPVQSITSITYTDSAGASQTLASSVYQLVTSGDHGRARIVEAYDKSWPSTRDEPQAVTIRFVAGYGTDASSPPISQAPEAIKHAMLLMIGHFYENREATLVGVNAQDLPLGVNALLQPYRASWF